MTQATLERLFGVRQAFDHPVTVGVTIGLVAALTTAPLVLAVFFRVRGTDPRVETSSRDATVRGWCWCRSF